MAQSPVSDPDGPCRGIRAPLPPVLCCGNRHVADGVVTAVDNDGNYPPVARPLDLRPARLECVPPAVTPPWIPAFAVKAERCAPLYVGVGPRSGSEKR